MWNLFYGSHPKEGLDFLYQELLVTQIGGCIVLSTLWSEVMRA